MAIIGKEAEAIVSLIGEVNSSIQKIGAGWFSSGREIELYQVKARSLGDRLSTWNGLIHSHGLSEHHVVKPILDVADSTVKCLDEEAVHLKELRHSCCLRYRNSLMRSIFPRVLNLKLKSLGTAFQTLDVPAFVEEVMKATQLRQPNHWAKPPKLPFSRDGRYVPIQRPLEDVMEALERKDGPQVVTLSGGPGTGKTTLVKSLALAYQEKVTGMVAVDPSGGRVADSERGFKHFVNGIVYIACGNEAESRLKIVELLHSFGSYLQLSTEDNKEHESLSEEVLFRRLAARLEQQEALVILDDVQGSDFLRRLLVPGKNLKYLVTTQDSSLCTGDFSKHNVVMPKPERGVAQAIFQSFFTHITDAPSEFVSSTEGQELVRKMTEAAQANPVITRNLAIAVSGSTKCTGRSLMHWESVLGKFQAGQQPRNGMVEYNDKLDRREVLRSFELAVDSMPMEAQHLLLLAVQCEGPLVPEVVLRLLHRITSKRPLNSFSNWTNYVENTDLIQLHEFAVPWSQSQMRLWSTQGLQYISSKLAKSEEEMELTDCLLADNPQSGFTGSGDYSFCVDDKLVAALCFVYGKKNLSDKAAVKLTALTPSQGRGLLRLAVEPVVWLLHCDHEIEEEWEQTAFWSARGVLMAYISEGKLDDPSAEILLSIPQTAPTMCRMLQIIGETDERCILTTETPLSLQSLLKLLTRDADPTFELQRRATETLASLADKSYKAILANSCTLERLMRLLAKDIKPGVQAGAALALGKLAATDDISSKIANYPSLIPKLMELMDRENISIVQENAAFALSRLALNPQNALRIVDFSGSLKRLSYLMSVAVDTPIRVQASKALANLSQCEKVTHRILVHAGILSSAIRLLAEDLGSEVQFQASRLVINLSASPDNHSKICQHPGAMEVFVALLKPFLRSTIILNAVAVQDNICRILANLSATKIGKSSIVGTPDALKHLLSLLGEGLQSERQKYVIKCLSNVASTALEANRAGAVRSSHQSESIVTSITLTPEQRQILSEFVTNKCSSAIGSTRYDAQVRRESGRIDNRVHEDGWLMVRHIKYRWGKVFGRRFSFGFRRRTQSIRDDSDPSLSHFNV